MNARLPMPPECLAEDTDPIRLTLVCGIVKSARLGAKPLLRGLDEEEFQRMCATLLPGMELANAVDPAAPEPFDEFEDLLELLLEHAASPAPAYRRVACAVATAAQRDNHLWQDMGLPSRRELSSVLNACFPTLAARNVKDMKWKKFFYRELCARAEVPICKSPNCVDCCDYAQCFGPEE